MCLNILCFVYKKFMVLRPIDCNVKQHIFQSILYFPYMQHGILKSLYNGANQSVLALDIIRGVLILEHPLQGLSAIIIIDLVSGLIAVASVLVPCTG